MTVAEAIRHFQSQRQKSDLSIGDVRTELKETSDFTDIEISQICTALSDSELEELNKPKGNLFSVFNSIYIAYFLTIAFAVLLVVAIVKIQQINALADLEGVEQQPETWNYLLLAGSIFFLFRNGFRVIKHLGAKK